MTSSEIRFAFLEFFRAREHTIVPSSSLIPNDPSVLLTTAGMQQFKPYYVGRFDPEKIIHPNLDKPIGKNAASIQKSFRTSDIDEVGDESHLTFFEMLGNFSFGGYFKEGAIEYAHEFITKTLRLSIDFVSVFAGDSEVPFDGASERVWRTLGVTDIRTSGRNDNFWGPTGAEGPCGPTTEIYVKNVAGKPIEIWNIVFNEYFSNPDGSVVPIEEKGGRKGVDTGMGLERLAMVVQNVPTIFETDLFNPILSVIHTENLRIKRIISDHIRGAVHLIADGVQPSNKDRGYILRRLLRRATFHAIDIASEQAKVPLSSTTPRNWNEGASLKEIAALAMELSYFKISEKKDAVFAAIDKEIDFFELLKSRKELRVLIRGYSGSGKNCISGEDAFKLVSTFGIPIDYIRDEAAKSGLKIDPEGFEDARRIHQEISRTGQEKKFGGHGLILDTGELKVGSDEELKKVTRLHTATHLLQQSLRDVLGKEVRQMGSDITVVRTRFDFTFPRKLTPGEVKRIEDIVNEKIKEDLPVTFKELPREEAEKTGALYFFKEKYPEKVKVYFVGRDLSSAYSKEFCGGPHVHRTGEIGDFRVMKEEAVGAGVRRIRGMVYP